MTHKPITVSQVSQSIGRLYRRVALVAKEQLYAGQAL
jgi:hypothetical protein